MSSSSRLARPQNDYAICAPFNCYTPLVDRSATLRLDRHATQRTRLSAAFAHELAHRGTLGGAVEPWGSETVEPHALLIVDAGGEQLVIQTVTREALKLDAQPIDTRLA